MKEIKTLIPAKTERQEAFIVETITEPTEHSVIIESGAQADISATFIQSEDQPYHLKLFLAGDRAQLKFNGLIIGVGEQKPFVKVDIIHQGLHTDANVIFRGLLTDNAEQEWRGMIIIEPQAQHTNSWLEDRTLLITKTAKATAVPSLEIEANEVRASHAATVSKISPEQMFYLAARGIDTAQAKQLIVNGFIKPVRPRQEAAQQKINELLINNF